MDNECAAALIWMMRIPSVRDSALLVWAFGEDPWGSAAEDGPGLLVGGRMTDQAAAALLWGEGPRPDVDRVEAAILLLGYLGASAPRSARVPILTMLAWLHWALGRSSVAGKFVELALAIAPDYSLAEIIGGMLAAGRLPEWAFDG